jgi:hypothetical protein
MPLSTVHERCWRTIGAKSRESEAVGTNTPTGCATRWQQASCIIRSCFTSNPDHIACMLATLLKFRLSAATMKATTDGLEPLRLKTIARCALRGTLDSKTSTEALRASGDWQRRWSHFFLLCKKSPAFGKLSLHGADGGYEQARFWTFLLVLPVSCRAPSRSSLFVVVR